MRVHIGSVEAKNGFWAIYFETNSPDPDSDGNIIGYVVAVKMVDMYIGYGYIFRGAWYNPKDNTINIPVIFFPNDVPKEFIQVLKRLPHEIDPLLDPNLPFEEIDYLIEQGVIDEDDLNSFILTLHLNPQHMEDEMKDEEDDF